MTVKKFSLRRNELPIEIETESGSILKLRLVELSGQGRDEYMNFVNKRLKIGPSGKVESFESLEGLQTELVSRCLFYQDSDKRVEKSEIQNWRASVVEELFNLAQKLNGLDRSSEQEIKNV